jgi:hypothetical protein
MSHQSVVIAVLEPSATLSGLSGVPRIHTYAGSLDDDVPVAVHRSLHKVVLVLLTAFGVGLSSVAVSAAWLVAAPYGDTFYDVALSVFALQIAGLAAATGWTVRGLSWAQRRKREVPKDRT